MCTRQTEFVVAKHVIGFMAVRLDGCIFVWVGKKNRLDALCFAQLFRGMTLIESPKPNHLTDSFAVKLNKLFPNKQVFFSTDLSIEDATFWSELLQAIANYTTQNKEFFDVA